jgi:preprotein translocase subunit SecY
VPIQQAKHVRGPKVYGGQKHYLPLKVNQAGVIPIIFAQALLMFPATIAQSLIQAGGLEEGVIYGILNYIREVLSGGGTLTLTYILVFGSMIFFFCYFWTAVTFNPQEMSENLQDHGSFIPGIRPGERTAKYLEGIMNRVTMAGAFFLVAIALMPMFVSAALGVRGQIAGFYGGTSILIVVGVTLDLVRRINNHLEMRRYDSFASGRGTRRRRR